MTNMKPEQTLRDGHIKATIWRNESDNGAYFSTTLSRSYQDKDGGWHDTHSLSGTELLRAAKLLEESYSRCRDLQREDRADDRDTRQETDRSMSAERDGPQQRGRDR